MYLIDRTKQTTCRPCAFLPCATEGCPYAVIKKGTAYCCMNCKNGKNKHSRCDHTKLPMIDRAQAEWEKLKPCATRGCDHAIYSSSTALHCCRLCSLGRGHKHDDKCDPLFIVGAAPQRRMLARVDRFVTSACRGLYESAMSTFRQLEARRRQSILVVRGKASPAASKACQILYSEGVKAAARKVDSQVQRQTQLSTMVQREQARTKAEREERQRIYDAQNGWLVA